MSNPESPGPAFTLSIDEVGDRVTQRSEASVPPFVEIMRSMVSHEAFCGDMPAVWDLTKSTGFHRLSLEDLGRMVTISRRSRASARRYRVSLVTRGDPEFGMGRMLQGRTSGQGPFELGVVRSREAAERWAFASNRS